MSGRLFHVNRNGVTEVTEARTERVTVGETRRIRVVGDQVIESAPMREAEHAAPAVVAVQQIRESEAGPDTDDEPTLPVSGHGPHGLVTIQHADVRRRWPALESWLSEVEGIPDARVWAVSHWDDRRGRLDAMIREGRGGRAEVFVNLVGSGAACPVKLLGGVLAHEAAHWMLGHTRTPFGHDERSEAAAEAVTSERIESVVQLVDARVPGETTTNPEPCRQCFTSGSRQCLQPGDVLDRVQAALQFYR
jgi:hypothetical protein